MYRPQFSNRRKTKNKDPNNRTKALGTGPCKLESLKVDCERCYETDDDSLINLINVIYTRNPELKHLDLGVLGNSKITDRGLNHISKSLEGGFRKLESFQLNLVYLNEITDNALMNIIKATGTERPNFKKLKFNLFGSENITNIALEEFANFFKSNLTNLEDLDLRFGDCRIGDEGIKAISKIFSTSSSKLQRLNLNFEQNRKITISGFKALEEALSSHSLGNISTLKLGFYSCGGDFEKGLQIIGNAISKRFVKIEFLELDFDGLGYSKTDYKTLKNLKKLLDPICSKLEIRL